MNRSVFCTVMCVMMCVVVVACAASPGEEQAAAAQADPVVASFEGGQITAAELEEAAGSRLMDLRQQIYDAKVEALKQQVFEQLVEKKAAAEGLSREQYLKKNITDKVGEPSEDEINKVVNQYRARLPKDDAQARSQVVNYLQGQLQQNRELEFRDMLFNEAGLRILLDPPRVEAKIAEHNPSQGPEDAPITIIEYTDFQCPYCGRAQATLNQVFERYGDRVRHVFKHLPLPMHQQARLAAEASLCAEDQGTFWPFHDWMFANKNDLNRENIIAQAEAQGMDVELFTKCLDQKTHGAAVQEDLEEARSFGITGTPGFLVNGRLVKGAQPFEAFEQIIDDELRRKGLPVPKPVAKDNDKALPDSDDPREAPRAVD